MASRMEKYYKTRDSKRRIVRNEELYQTIYADETYSNIEGVVATPKANEINIEKIRDLITSHEMQKRQNRQLVRKPVNIEPEIAILEDDEDKNYDIRDILVKAKDSREDHMDEPRSLKNTEYNILKNIKINNKSEFGQEEELKDLINTITNTSLLNKMGDKELSLNMFDELKSDTMIGDNASIHNLLKEEKIEKTGEMDNSFFSPSLNFKDKDFEKLQDINKSISKNGKLMNIILTLLFIVVAVILLLLIYKVIIK